MYELGRELHGGVVLLGGKLRQGDGSAAIYRKIISYKFLNLYETKIMQEKLTILISSENKEFLKRHAQEHNKSMSQFIDDMLASIKRQGPKDLEKDEWINKTAGTYRMGSKDVLDELFKDIVK